MPVTETLLHEQLDEEEECQGLATNPETRLQPATPEEEEVDESRTSEDGAGIQDSRIPRFEDEDDKNKDTHFQEVEEHRATDFGPSTLGRSHSRSKTISRSIVPMMRKMFERAKSCDPDVISPHGDGTESSRLYTRSISTFLTLIGQVELQSIPADSLWFAARAQCLPCTILSHHQVASFF